LFMPNFDTFCGKCGGENNLMMEICEIDLPMG
jgi:hypothetical protein